MQNAGLVLNSPRGSNVAVCVQATLHYETAENKLSYDHLFNFNSYMCKITNDICAVHSPVFATILKADK